MGSVLIAYMRLILIFLCDGCEVPRVKITRQNNLTGLKVEDILLRIAFKIVYKPTPAVLADVTRF